MGRDINSMHHDGTLPEDLFEEAVEPKTTQGVMPAASSWWPIDLSTVGTGTVAPTILGRTDGLCLLYPGRVNALFGSSGSGKSWVALGACMEVLENGGSVVYVDYEDNGKGMNSRLEALRVSSDDKKRFSYVRPVDPADAGDIAKLCAEFRPDLVVFDGVTSAYELQGLDPNSGADTNSVYRLLFNPWTAAGSAVLTIDHVVKNRDKRGGHATGSAHKRALVRGSQYEVRVDTPFGQGRIGRLRLIVCKDTPGAGPASRGELAGTVVLESFPRMDPPRVTWRIEPPSVAAQHSSEDLDPEERLKKDAERVSRYVEKKPNIGARELESMGGIRKARIQAAKQYLEREGHLVRVKDGNRLCHTITKPFRMSPRPPPIGGGDVGDGGRSPGDVGGTLGGRWGTGDSHE